MKPIKPFIWFEGVAEEAMNFYVDVFDNSKILSIERYSGDQGIPGEEALKGKVLNGIFDINGQEFMCLDGGHQFNSNGPISFVVEFDTQEGLDKVWNRLLDGGRTQMCGWITDKYEITWQIIPSSLGRMMSDPMATAKQKQALMQAMMPMVKLEIDKLEAAFSSAKE